MERHFTVKDLVFLSGLLLVLITLVLTMYMIDRQWLKLSELETRMREQASDLRGLRDGVKALGQRLDQGVSLSGQGGSTARATDVPEAFRRAQAATFEPDFGAGDWLVQAFGTGLKTITPLVSTDAYASEVQGYVQESLLTRNPETLDWEGLLAKDWDVSDDGLTYVFHLRPGLTFSDGEPLTAEDVAFTFRYIMDPRIAAPRQRAYYDKMASVRALGPLDVEKHYVSRRSRSQKGVLVFLARDTEQRVMCYSNAHVSKSEQADEILRFVEFWTQQTGAPPQELVFDSQLTTYANLYELDKRGIRFLTLRRRTRKLLAELYARPNSAWRRATLRSLTRTYRTPRVFDERIQLAGYGEKPLRQLSILDLGHEEPTLLLTNDMHATPATLITRYAQRMLIENGIAEAIHFFHIDALSSMLGLKVDFDLQLTLMASSLYRAFARHLPENYHHATAKVLFDNLLDVAGTVQIDTREIIVTLDKRAHNPYLVDSRLAEQPTPMPWLDGKALVIKFA
jgi:hypothetical protein